MDSMIWKQIKNYPKYEVSDSGLVRIVATNKIKKPYFHYGYEKMQLYNDSGRSSFRVHRLVAEAFLKDYDNSLPIDHINRVRQDNRLVNLRVITQKENTLNRSRALGLVDEIIDWYLSGVSREDIKNRLS